MSHNFKAGHILNGWDDARQLQLGDGLQFSDDGQVFSTEFEVFCGYVPDAFNPWITNIHKWKYARIPLPEKLELPKFNEKTWHEEIRAWAKTEEAKKFEVRNIIGDFAICDSWEYSDGVSAYAIRQKDLTENMANLADLLINTKMRKMRKMSVFEAVKWCEDNGVMMVSFNGLHIFVNSSVMALETIDRYKYCTEADFLAVKEVNGKVFSALTIEQCHEFPEVEV